VLDKGFLADALRASMSIPTIFRPMELDGRLLVDGYLVRNLPVSDVRDMGADYLIGVDVGAPLYKKEELTSLFKVLDQVTNFRGAEDTRRQHELCDLLIQPELDEFNPTDFDRADSLIAAGERAARAMLPRLKSITDSLGAVDTSEEPEQDYRNSPIKQFYVSELRTEGLHDVSEELLLGKLQLDIPSRMTVEHVEQAVERAWGSKFFERVSYRIEPGENGTALVIRVVEQNDDYLRLGVHYDNDTKSAVLVNLMYRNLGIEGSKLSLSANLSENESYSVEYLVFTNWQPGIALGFGEEYYNLNIFLYDKEGQVQANLDFTVITSEFSVSTIFSNKFVAGLAGQYRETRLKNIFAPPDWHVGSYSLANFLGFATLDTWDRTIYPKSGVHLNLVSMLTADLFKSEFVGMDIAGSTIPRSFLVYSLQLDGAIPLSNKMSLLYGTRAGTISRNQIPEDYKFYLGGQYYTVDQGFPFMGLKFLERPGTHAYVLQAGLQYEFAPGQVIQLRSNAGKVTDSRSDLFKRNGTDFGAGLTFGWHSPIGPLEYSVSYGNRRREVISNVNVGYRF
jgi:NTE family protein